MAKNDKKSQVLGDDPLAWLTAGSDTKKKKDKKNITTKKKVSKKSVPRKKVSKPAKLESASSKKSNKVKPLKNKKVEIPNRLELESSVVINKANDIHEALKKLAENGQAIEIDASKVEIIDSAILQLILAFILSLKQKDIKLSWHEPTEGLLNKASILGLTEQLGL